MRKDNNKIIKNAALIGLGLLGLKYVLPKIMLTPTINVDSPEHIIDFVYLKDNNYPLTDNGSDGSDYSNGSGSDGDSGSNSGNTGLDTEPIIDYAPPVDDTYPIKDYPNDPGLDPYPVDPPDPNPVDPPNFEKIINNAPPYEDIISKEIRTSSKSDSEPIIDTSPIIKTYPIKKTSTIASTMKGIFFDMFNELMLGDKTWYYSQQDIINMERLKPFDSNIPNPHCCKFIENNQSEKQLPNKEIFY